MTRLNDLDGEVIASEPRVTPRRPKGSLVPAAAPSPSKHDCRNRVRPWLVPITSGLFIVFTAVVVIQLTRLIPMLGVAG